MNDDKHRQAPNTLQQLLQGAPEPGLPDTLWPTLRARHAAIRRNRMLGVAGMLATVVVAAGFLNWAPGASDGRQAADVVAQETASDMDADIRAIDTALQTAYAEGLSDTDISPLWRERERLMSLRNARSSGAVPKGGQA